MTLVDIIAMAPTILQGVTSVIGGFAILAKLTPTKADDAFIQKVLSFIHLGALNLKVDATPKDGV